ncbi:MAG: phosphonate ABC transporter, permease protein PhnE [Rhodocyclaceae bacterium]|jgi:phosphonate transport system permease protein|nr:phosphonate ABC transporter, permease protein PhnE [Rhodocyclaceae bacterium]MDP3031617.1 phosphonate ABC transporter, permease protein PhnE [Rhodocyclaceae bacterium]
MRENIANFDAASIAAIRARHPLAFQAPLSVRLRNQAAWFAFFVLTAYCFWTFDLSPARLWAGSGTLLDVASRMFPPTVGDAFNDYLWALFQTIAMAFLGTVIAAVLAVPLGLLCARNVLPVRIAQFFFRRTSDTLRGIDQVIWALIFVRAVGLGPLAGILAIIISDTGTLAKLYSEAIENAEKKQVDGIRGCGGNPLQTIRFGIIPQVLPVMLSNVLYIFESNTRSATILGIVGAGGIGFYLADRIRTMLWEEASFIMIMILIAVYVIDWISKLIRRRLIGGAAETSGGLH